MVEGSWEFYGYVLIGPSCAEFEVGDSRLREATSGDYTSVGHFAYFSEYRYAPLKGDEVF